MAFWSDQTEFKHAAQVAYPMCPLDKVQWPAAFTPPLPSQQLRVNQDGGKWKSASGRHRLEDDVALVFLRKLIELSAPVIHRFPAEKSDLIVCFLCGVLLNEQRRIVQRASGPFRERGVHEHRAKVPVRLRHRDSLQGRSPAAGARCDGKPCASLCVERRPVGILAWLHAWAPQGLLSCCFRRTWRRWPAGRRRGGHQFRR